MERALLLDRPASQLGRYTTTDMFFKQRVPQDVGTRGSLKWIQRLVDTNPALLTDAIRASVGEQYDWTIDWVSPRRADDWAEYRDAQFLVKVGLPQHRDALAAFWPSGGPQWDALGISSSKDVILIEAKAHFDELTSHCGAGEGSRVLIDAALANTKTALAAAADADWSSPYYQYANRLAHLHFLRSLGVGARLAFVYFYGDTDMKGPMSPSEWKQRLSVVKAQLTISRPLEDVGVVDIFIPVQVLDAPVI
jgi:hypothetical protein